MQRPFRSGNGGEQGEFAYGAEVRSLFYRLIGLVADPETAVSRLRSHAESEMDPLARACLFERLLVAMMRSGLEWQDEVVLLKAAMQADARVSSQPASIPFDYVWGERAGESWSRRRCIGGSAAGSRLRPSLLAE